MRAPCVSLPQLGGGIFLTDSGLETTLIFHDGLELPYFAAFTLLRSREGRDHLRRYYERHIAIAKEAGMGFVLESATWRASPDWAARLGWSAAELDAANGCAIALMLDLRARYERDDLPMVVSGCVGPRGDGYDPGRIMSVAEALRYHGPQVALYAASGAHMITAITMTNVTEAIGIAQAAAAAGKPAVISFTVETDGRLPTGQTLGDAIAEVDRATADAVAYYMINCAHPLHFAAELASDGAWTKRIRGIRANASERSHRELDEATDLDAGNPVTLGAQYRCLRRRHPHITVLGGCCGTDHRHVEQIARACARAA